MLIVEDLIHIQSVRYVAIRLTVHQSIKSGEEESSQNSPTERSNNDHYVG